MACIADLPILQKVVDGVGLLEKHPKVSVPTCADEVDMRRSDQKAPRLRWIVAAVQE